MRDGGVMDSLDRLKAALSDRYAIERELGAGGMATVYLAEDLKHHRKVAVKVLRPVLAVVLGAERFLNEIKVTASVQHPHILPLHDSGEVDGFLYYVMPFVEGESLRDRLNREKQLSVEDALKIASEVADALGSAHRHGVVHRDIKPENILLREGHAVVADFGIARAVESAGGDRLTETGMSLGTPAYMSPEQVAGDRELDGRSDVYSLACVLYEMLAGDPPFVASNPQAILAKHVTDPAPPIMTVRSSVPVPVATAIAKALGKARADRFESAQAFSEALFAQAAEAERETKSIVVLPFENLSPDPDNAFFADGLTEELIADLSKVRALRVISRTSAMLLRGSKKDVPTIARELNVRYALEGSVRRAGNSLRITAQLIDAEADEHMWAEKYTGTLDDVFAIQEEVSQAIVEALRVELTAVERHRMSERAIEDLRAYDAYLRANVAIGRMTEEGAQDALQQLEVARSIVGDNALLDCGSSYAYFWLANMGIRIDDNLDKCEEWAKKALALDPASAKARALLGLAGFEYRGKRPSPEAVGHLKRALENDPDEPQALLGLAIVYAFAGKMDAAAALGERYIQREPLDVWAYAIPVYIAWWSGRYDEGLQAVDRIVAEWHDAALQSQLHLAWGLALVGRREEAIAAAERAASAAPGHVHATLALLLKRGLEHDVEGVHSEFTPEFHEYCYREPTWSYFAAAAFALAGAVDDALKWLEHAVDIGWINYPLMAEKDPFLESLRGDPRFERLMVRVKKEWEEFEV